MAYKSYLYHFAILFTCVLSAQAQHTLVYAPLRCQGPIPADFLKLSTDKVLNDQDKIDEKKLSKRERKIEKEFALNSNFGIDGILLSGKVLYGDPLTEYVNKVADKILANHSQIRAETRFYVIKSSSVNAFSTNQGIIFITVGLLGQIKSEAELAFILCHELSHYIKKHNLEQYKIQADIKDGKGRFRNLYFYERVSEYYNYSKDNELEADRSGLNIFMNTPYSSDAVLSSFDMLLYAHLPYDTLSWNKTEFQDEWYRFPGAFAPKKYKPIHVDAYSEDENRTHPNIGKRKDALKLAIEKEKPAGNTTTLLGEDYFRYIQQQARIELMFILLNYARYEQAYYLSYLYKHHYKDYVFASKIAAYCLFAKASGNLIHEKNKTFNNSSQNDFRAGQGAFYNIAYFFDHIENDELAILSVRMTWQAYKNNPEDRFCRTMFEQSANNLFQYTSLSLSDFSKLDEITGSDSNQKTDSLQNGSVIKKTGDFSYKQYAFAIMLNEDHFQQALKLAYEVNAENKASESVAGSKRSKKQHWHKKYGYAGDMDSFILVNPSFTKSISGRKIKRDLLFDEKQEFELSGTFMEMAKQNNFHVKPVNLLDKQTLTTEKINEYAEIMEWLSERIYNNSEEVPLYNSQFIEEFSKRSGTPNLCLSSVNYRIEAREFEITGLLLGIFMWPTMPFYLYYQLHRKHNLVLTTLVFDLNTGKMTYAVSNRLRLKNNKKDYMQAQIYALFHQLKQKR